MENMIKKQTFVANSTTHAPTPLSMHRGSQMISKPKPKIRIIHIFAPEIIKTDVANFRELVQRLTGKPTSNDHHHRQKVCHKKKPLIRTPRREEPAKKMEMRSSSGGFFGLETRERVKEEDEEDEEEIWNGANKGGFLNGFADFDGFIHELGEFPLMPLDSTHHYMHGFEEAHQLA